MMKCRQNYYTGIHNDVRFNSGGNPTEEQGNDERNINTLVELQEDL